MEWKTFLSVFEQLRWILFELGWTPRLCDSMFRSPSLVQRGKMWLTKLWAPFVVSDPGRCGWWSSKCGGDQCEVPWCEPWLVERVHHDIARHEADHGCITVQRMNTSADGTEVQHLKVQTPIVLGFTLWVSPPFWIIMCSNLSGRSLCTSLA